MLLKGPAAFLGLSPARNCFLAKQGPSTTKKINNQKIAERTINMCKLTKIAILCNPQKYEHDNSVCTIRTVNQKSGKDFLSYLLITHTHKQTHTHIHTHTHTHRHKHTHTHSHTYIQKKNI